MWWKKLLYFLLITVLGFGIVVISGSINFNYQSKNLMRSFVESKEYVMVERFFCYTTPKEELYKYRNDKDDVHIDAYECLVKQPYYIYYSDEGYVVKYDIIEEALAFSLFNLPNNFKLADSGKNKGGVLLHFDTDETIMVNFDNRFKEDGEMNYYINFYSYISQYDSLTVYITYDDFLSLISSETAKINMIEIVDGNGVSFYQFPVGKPFNFEGPMHEKYREACKEYREFMLEYGQSIGLGAFEEKKRLLTVIDDITANDENYFAKPSTNIIFASMSFILTISIVSAAYISIAIVVTRLIFHRKKRS